MKIKPLLAFLALVFATLACSIQNIQMKTIETQVKAIAEPMPSNSDVTELKFRMTGGKFSLVPGAQGLVNGTISYNVEQWEPEFTRRHNFYKIRQVDPFNFTGLPSGDVENNWDIALSSTIPINLSIEGGASENFFDLTGLQLTDLNIVQGASETIVRFDTLNPVAMKSFTFTTGASSAELFGLANANFETMTISAGAGDYTLDFSGILSRETTVDIKAGVSNIKIIIPAGMNATINNLGIVTNINTKGTWLLSDNTYTTEAEGAMLTINLNVSVGNVSLIRE
jgi:hypothetical protein